jgi:hypothetical protein
MRTAAAPPSRVANTAARTAAGHATAAAHATAASSGASSPRRAQPAIARIVAWLAAAALAACSGSEEREPGADAAPDANGDADASDSDAAGDDGGLPDGSAVPAEQVCDDGGDDDGDGLSDCEDPDCTMADKCAYACGAFTAAPEWEVAAGLRAVIVADASDGLMQPVGVTFAGAKFGGRLFVSDQQARAVFSVDTTTGDTEVFVSTGAFPSPARLLTAIVWDADGLFDGRVYVSDSVTDGDQDNVIYRIAPDGSAEVFVAAPGPGLDSVYAMAFSPRSATPLGLYVAGDTDGAGPDWGVFDAAGNGTAFSDVGGVEGIAFDARYGPGPIAARPLGGGYDGDGTITPLALDGAALAPIAADLGGVHANVVAPPGLFQGEMLAASWSDGRLFRVAPDGTQTDIATGLQLTNYDANILAVSPDGRVLLVADRLASRVVCIEQVADL